MSFHNRFRLLFLTCFFIVTSILGWGYLNWYLHHGKYLHVMGVITDRNTINKIRPFFKGDYGYTALLDRIDDLKAADRSIGKEIVLEMLGREKNGENSILYVAACYANGLDARLIVSHPPDGRVWTEVKISGTWVHVDPWEKIVDDPYTYWRSDMPLKNVMAYGVRNYENVTMSYLPTVCESCIG